MNYFSYGDDQKALLKLDPRTKVLLFLTGGFIAINSIYLPPLCVYISVLCGLMALSGKRSFALKVFIIFAITVYFQSMLLSTPTEVGGGSLTMLLGGLCMLVIFSFPLVLGFVFIVQTTRISQFLAAFKRMHLPNAVVIPLAVFFRFIPTVQEEWSSITKAMAFRGISMTPASVLLHPLKTTEQILVPLLFSSISVIDELSAAALARGLDSSKKRESYAVVKLRIPDYLVMALVVAMVILVLAIR